MNITYNTERESLVIPEYGRYVSFIAQHLLTIENREQRNKQSQALVKILENISQTSNKGNEYQNRLWDHLHLMTDCKLDIDAPYPKPEIVLNADHKKRLDYPKINQTHRYYGIAIKRLVDSIASWEEGEKKEKAKKYLANHMKKKYILWNKTTTKDFVILEHLKELSDGKIDLTQDENFVIESTNKSFVKRKKRVTDNNPKKNNL